MLVTLSDMTRNDFSVTWEKSADTDSKGVSEGWYTY